MPEPVLDRTAANFIPVAYPSVTALEISHVVGAMRAAQLTAGPRVEEFESRFAHDHGCDFGIACNSGTSAIQLAIEGLDLRGKTVAMPTMAMVACPNAVIHAGATPVFVDSDLARGNIDLSRLHDLAGQRKIDAALVIHLYGVPVEFAADEFSFPVVEDCAEAHYGNFENGQKIGSRGIAACFSYFSNKVVCTGEGGMVTTGNAHLAARLKSIRAHAFTPDEHFHHRELANGMRMSELAGAFGCAQLDRIAGMLIHRAKLAAAYTRALIGVDWIDFQYRPVGSANWIFPALVNRNLITTLPLAHVRQKLADAGIETRGWFKPMHLQPHLKQYVLPGQSYPVAEDLWRRGFYLPLHCNMSVDDVERICDAIKAI